MSKSSIASRSSPRWATLASRVAVAAATALFSLAAASIAAAQSSPLKLQDNAPDRYIVEKGNTLWGISSKFLKDPWRWPELWKMNQDQITNPNRIYPGNIIVLDRTKSPPQVTVTGTVRLSPQVRSAAASETQAIPSIPAKVIEPFLTQPLVIESGGLDKAAAIIGTQESRVNIGAGGFAYVTGVGDAGPAQTWNIYRPGKALLDPDTKSVLGTEAIFLGTGRITRSGDPSTLEIISSKQEIGVGDRLIAAGPASVTEYVPHPPKSQISGRIIGLYDGLPTSEAGTSSVVAINRGKRDGIEQGHVLAILRAGSTVADPRSSQSRDNAPKFNLPDERYGLLFVFRVFDAVSYGLVMQSTRPVSPADIVRTP
jgi:hypothetical protein